METQEEKLTVEVTQETSWRRALNAARRTAGKPETVNNPSARWIAEMLIAEHSVIKLVEYHISFKNLRQWVGVHLLRHEHLLPFIQSQREDRSKLDCSRDELPQGTPNVQDFYANAQTLVNISRKRLCRKSSPETRAAWSAVRDKVKQIDMLMAHVMVPNCVYRGFCPEPHGCGYCFTHEFEDIMNKYRSFVLYRQPLILY